MLNRILSSKEKINTSNKRLCKVLSALILVLSLVLSLAGCSGADIAESINPSQNESTTVQTDKAGGSNSSNKNNSADKNDTLAAGTDSADWRATLPEYSDSPYVIVNNNEPFFTENDMTVDSFEYYGELDELGRCTVAYASIGKDLMPTEKRGSIGSVKPTGWHTVKYDFVDGKYLYNRCHLIGYQLTAENANEKNLITGTRYLNVQGMLPFENMTADYVKETENHVLYRVTPVFEGNNLVAAGVLMEAESVEDKGEGVEFCVFVYNAQPGVTIDYATGDSWLDENGTGNQQAAAKETKTVVETEIQAEKQTQAETTQAPAKETSTYILNTNSKKFHKPGCSAASQIKAANKDEFTGTRDEVIAKGYEPCKKCNP